MICLISIAESSPAQRLMPSVEPLGPVKYHTGRVHVPFNKANAVELRSSVATESSEGSAPQGTQQTDRRFQDSLHLFVLWSFAFAQPLFDRLASNPTFLTDLRISRTSVLLAVVMVSVTGPTIMICAELLVNMWHRGMRRWLHHTVIASLLAIIVLPLLCRIRFLPEMIHIGLALAAGVVGALLNRRFKWVRILLTAAAPAIVVFPCWLLFFSPVSRVLPHQTAGTTDDRNVENIDVLPTIAHFLAMTPPVKCDGYSMLDTARVERTQKRFFNGTELATVTADFQSRVQELQSVLRRFGFVRYQRLATAWYSVRVLLEIVSRRATWKDSPRHRSKNSIE